MKAINRGVENDSPVRFPMKAPITNSPTPDSRPGSASLPVRPVTARTWQAINGGDSPKRVSVYNNDLYSGAAAEDPQSPQYRPSSARPATPRSAERLQQQLVGSPGGRGGPDRTSSPSRLQMSTANVPHAPPKLAQPAPSDSLDSLLARATKAVAEDAAQQQQQQQQEAPVGGQEAAPSAAPADDPAKCLGTVPDGPSRPAATRLAAVSLAALQTPRLATPSGVLGARDSQQAQQLFQNFAGSAPAGRSSLPGTPRMALGTGAGNLGNTRGSLAGQRPSTPSFQPVSANRPATAMANFSIKSGAYPNVGGEAGPVGQAAVGSSGSAGPPLPSRHPYPLPPSTAPAKANLLDAAPKGGQSGGLSSFGIMSGAFIAAPAKSAAGVEGDEDEEPGSIADLVAKAALKAMMQSDLLAWADVATKAGLRRFLLAPGPTDKPLQCKIHRAKSGFMKSHAQYVLVLEDGEGFLLAGQKRKSGTRGTEYTISVDQNDLSHASANFCGKLRSNFIGTEFVCYDDAEKPRAGVSTTARCELAAITYQTNVLGTKGPRKMTVLIPKLDAHTNKPLKLQAGIGRNGMLTRYKQYDLQDTVVLRNKPPKWNDTLNAYCLNFGGRVTQASVKNFQLVSVDNMERIILQFGKVGSDVFTMDYAYPMTALQAFAICLSSFDSKLACE